MAAANARLRFPGRDAMFLMYLATLMIPGQVTIIPNFILMRYFGWINTYEGLIIPTAFTAFGTFLLRQYFLSIPRELEEAARVDGASYFQVWSRIIMPLASPAIATLAVFSFMGAWNSFLWPFIMINTLEMRTLTVALRSFQTDYGDGMGADNGRVADRDAAHARDFPHGAAILRARHCDDRIRRTVGAVSPEKG